MIKALEKDCAQVKTNIFRSVARVNRDYLRITDEEQMVGSSVEIK